MIPLSFELLQTPVVPTGAVLLKADVAFTQRLLVPVIAVGADCCATVTKTLDIDTQPFVAAMP